MLVWLAGLAPCRAALAEGYCEREFVDAEGKHHRPDLLRLGSDATIVVDFKTGQHHPDHADQVRRYLALARSLPQRAAIPATGYIVYLDSRQCQRVEAQA